jgi:hypothetical protein
MFGVGAPVARSAVEHDEQNKRVTLSDAGHKLVLSLNYDGRCILDEVRVGGRLVVGVAESSPLAGGGVYSAIKIGDQWFSTRAGVDTPQVQVTSNTVTVTGIRFGRTDMEVLETWRFTVNADHIVWRVDRTYPTAGTIEDTCFPGWDFLDMSTWTGALLGHGGVAWTKLFDAPNCSYGVHNGKVTFWNKDKRACLRIVPESLDGSQIAVRFSRQPSGHFSSSYSITEQPLIPRASLRRFQRDQQDIWQSFVVHPGQVSVQFTLSALDYERAYGRGTFQGLDGRAIGEICHTIARIGAVDELILGSNGYYSGVAVLHEPWLAQLGIAIDDPDYCRALSDTLDFQRQHAIGTDGRVKARWADRPGDEMPGTYDQYGYYECQWGWLMDSQTSWVINVAEQFDINGDCRWLQAQKAACESALDYLLRRDTDGNGLVKVMTDSHLEGKGSDWIDVVWAAYENALVNAQMYWALSRWADCETQLNDFTQSARYRAAAGKLKHRFNQNTTEGGFWDAEHQCYAYWRDRDGSVHGTNLVVPVNFSAIGYGLCDEPARQVAILNRIEMLMRQEELFFWPLSFYSYAKEEVHSKVNWPFPKYENGDLFLAWGELGTRAYAAQNPSLALKYVKNVLAQYSKDGLAFQRYLRCSQSGEGKDILANNCSTIVGLYRNLYGLQPKFNRLYLEPHLTPELNDTRLNYWLRGKAYHLDLRVGEYSATVDNFTVCDQQPFGVNAIGSEVASLYSSRSTVAGSVGRAGFFGPNARSGGHSLGLATLEYFNGPSQTCSLSVTVSRADPFELTIRTWENAPLGGRSWSESCLKPGLRAQHEISGLAPNTSFHLSCNGVQKQLLRSDAAGRLVFNYRFSDLATRNFRLEPR